MNLQIRTNAALSANPPVGTQHLVTHGSDWLWAVTAVYCLALILVFGASFVARQGEKIFHYLLIVSLFTGSIAYFTMASDLGNTAVKVSDNVGEYPGTRQIFYAKYINWFVGWTPIIIAVGLVSGVSWATIFFNVTLSWIWVVCYLSGALVGTQYKWGFFVFGTIAYFALSHSLLFSGTIIAKRGPAAKHYTALAGYLVFFWLLYPIAYGLDDGGNRIMVTDGFIFFGILDLFTVPFFSIAILLLANKWDYGAMNLYFTQYGRVAQGGSFPEREKPAAPAAAPAAEV